MSGGLFEGSLHGLGVLGWFEGMFCDLGVSAFG